MTQQQSHAEYDPTRDYTLPAEEWAALLTLAAEASPVEAISAGGWRGDYFASAGARDAFGQLAEATGPALLDVPSDLAGVNPLSDLGELAKVRKRLAMLAQWRDWATMQHHMAARNREFLAALKSGGDLLAARLGDIEQLLSAARGALDAATAKGAGVGQVEAVTLGSLADPASFWARVADHRDAMRTGLAGLDKLLGGGLQAKRLAVLLGGPGGGKSTLSNQIAEHVADAGRPVVYLTLEDAPAVMLARTVARVGNIHYGAVLAGSDLQRKAIDDALAAISQRKSAARLLYLEDGATGGPIQPDTLRNMARQHFGRFQEDGRGLLVVDYLQRWARALMALPGEKRELRIIVSWLTERLRQIARELDCSVLCIASQNRASGYGKGDNSALASAKESGDIEYAADVVLALGEDEKRQASASFIKPKVLRLDKNRQGPVGKVDLDWYGDRQQLTEAGK